MRLDPATDYTHIVYLASRPSGGWQPTMIAADARMVVLVRHGHIIGWWNGKSRETRLVGMPVMEHMKPYLLEVEQ